MNPMCDTSTGRNSPPAPDTNERLDLSIRETGVRFDPPAPKTIEEARKIIQRDHGPRLTLMEVCGTHTASLAESGLRSLLPPSIRLVSGPGCPVCVTPSSYIDRLCELARKPNHVVLCFGDLIRVPGHRSSLSQEMAVGGQVRMIYSPLDALAFCRDHPEITGVVAAVGFETTAPGYGLLIRRARSENIQNLRLLTALRRMPPALELLCQADAAIDGFLAPGHVSAIIGSAAYEPLAVQYEKPFVIAGFEPVQVLMAIARLIQLCRADIGSGLPSDNPHAWVENQYPAVVRSAGNLTAQQVLADCFQLETAVWRGLGPIAQSGFGLAPAFQAFDAGSPDIKDEPELPGCRCGDLMRGQIEPSDCPLFGQMCRPETPVGPCMVSTEGACGIHFRYRSERGDPV